MPGINRTGGLAALLAPDIHKFYVQTGTERPVEWSGIFNAVTSEWNPYTDKEISGLGTAPSMPEGSMFTLDEQTMGGSKTYEAVPYGLAYEVTFPMFEDEQYGMINAGAKLLARASRNREEVDAFSLLNNAFSTSYAGFTASTSLCSTSHAAFAPGGSAQANRPNPDISFSITGLQAALIAFENLTDARGLPRLMQPTNIVIAPANKFNAREILGSSLKPFTANNEINSLVDEDLTYTVVHYLTTSTYWFVLAAKGEHDLNFWVRTAPTFDSFDDPWTKNAIFTVYQRHIPGFGAWQGIYGSTG
jgi:hypothetical protein